MRQSPISMRFLTAAAIWIAVTGHGYAGALSGGFGSDASSPLSSIKPLQSSGAGNILDCQSKGRDAGRRKQENDCEVPLGQEGSRPSDAVLPQAIKDLSDDSEVSHVNVRQQDLGPIDRNSLPEPPSIGKE